MLCSFAAKTDSHLRYLNDCLKAFKFPYLKMDPENYLPEGAVGWFELEKENETLRIENETLKLENASLAAEIGEVESRNNEHLEGDRILGERITELKKECVKLKLENEKLHSLIKEKTSTDQVKDQLG